MFAAFCGRVSVVAWAVVAAAAVSLVMRMPSVLVLDLQVLGSPISLNISDTLVMAAFVALLAASGTENAIRIHPRFQAANGTRWATWSYWALPAALPS